MTTPCPTCPTDEEEVGQHFSPGFIDQSDLSDLSDRKSKGGVRNSVSLSALAARWRADLGHDAAEAEAMAQHYAAPCEEPTLGSETEDFSLIDAWIRGAGALECSSVAEGLLRGFWAHRKGGAQ
jgi:hypothetical protein